MLTNDEMHDLWTRYVEAAAHQRPLEEVVHPDISLHLKGGVAKGIDEIKAMNFVDLWAAFPEMTISIEHVLVSGDYVTARVTVHSGPHSGTPYFGLVSESTKGRDFHMEEIHICRVQDGKIIEQWVQVDVLGLMEDIGNLEIVSTAA